MLDELACNCNHVGKERQSRVGIFPLRNPSGANASCSADLGVETLSAIALDATTTLSHCHFHFVSRDLTIVTMPNISY